MAGRQNKKKSRDQIQVDVVNVYILLLWDLHSIKKNQFFVFLFHECESWFDFGFPNVNLNFYIEFKRVKPQNSLRGSGGEYKTKDLECFFCCCCLFA